METENDLGIGTSNPAYNRSRGSSQNEIRIGGRDNGNGELRWLMRYLQARIEAMRSDEEDEDRENAGNDGDNESQAGSQPPPINRRSSGLNPPSSNASSSSTNINVGARSDSGLHNSNQARTPSGTTTPTPTPTHLPLSRNRTTTDTSSVNSTPSSQTERIRYSNHNNVDSDPIISSVASIPTLHHSNTNPSSPNPKSTASRDFNFQPSIVNPSGLATAASTSNRNSSPFGSPARTSSSSNNTAVFQNASTSPFSFKVPSASNSTLSNNNWISSSTLDHREGGGGSRELSPVNERIQSPFQFNSVPQEINVTSTSNRPSRSNKSRTSLGKTNVSSGGNHSSGSSRRNNKLNSNNHNVMVDEELEELEREDRGNGRRGALPIRDDEEMLEVNNDGSSKSNSSTSLRSRKKKRRESSSQDGNGNSV